MSKEFDLIAEQWIPVLPINEMVPVRVGIRDALLHAHEFGSIAADTPLETVASYRLLLAILQVAEDTKDDSWRNHWAHGKFAPASAVYDYLDRWENRFRLFDREHPFYQIGRLTRSWNLSAV